MSDVDDYFASHRVLYVKNYGTHLLTIRFSPIERTSWDKTERWTVWSPVWDLSATSQCPPEKRHASRRMSGSWCFVPHETLDYEIRDACVHAEWLLKVWGLAAS